MDEENKIDEENKLNEEIEKIEGKDKTLKKAAKIVSWTGKKTENGKDGEIVRRRTGKYKRLPDGSILIHTENIPEGKEPYIGTIEEKIEEQIVEQIEKNTKEKIEEDKKKPENEKISKKKLIIVPIVLITLLSLMGSCSAILDKNPEYDIIVT